MTEHHLRSTEAKQPKLADSQRSLLLNAEGLPGEALYDILGAIARCTYILDQKCRVFVDRDGRWLAGNEAARDFLGSPAAGLYFDHGKLKAAQGSEGCLQGLLAADGLAADCVISVNNGTSHVIFQAAEYDEHVVCITAVESHDDIVPQFVDLRAAFALTNSEDKVVRSLLGGNSPQEVANKLGVSINTIRAHLRHCYEKMGVTHREALWRKAFPYRIS